MEPRYVDDSFDDRDLSVKGQGFEDEALCVSVFKTLGRTRLQFKNDIEIAKWRRVDRACARGDFPHAWIEDRLKYAVQYHWSLSVLVGAILNWGKLDEWQRAQKPESTWEPERGSLEEPEAGSVTDS